MSISAEFLSSANFIFFPILLTHEGSHREVYQDFHPCYHIFRRWCQGLFRPQAPCTSRLHCHTIRRIWWIVFILALSFTPFQLQLDCVSYQIVSFVVESDWRVQRYETFHHVPNEEMTLMTEIRSGLNWVCLLWWTTRLIWERDRERLIPLILA